MTNSRITDPEVLETRFPVCSKSFPSGRERRRRRIQGRERSCQKVQVFERYGCSYPFKPRKFPPFGLKGGMPGKCGKNTLIRRDGSVIEAGGKAELKLKSEDVFVIETPGGGGYGRPENFRPEK